MTNKGYYVGSVEKVKKNKGWFYGHFMDEEMLRSDLVEVAWQTISGKKSSQDDKHIHRTSLEINIIISGKMRLQIDGDTITVTKGEFYVVYPGSVVESVEADENTELIVIKSPSVPDDKVSL